MVERAKEMLAQYQANSQVPNIQVINNGSGGMRWRCPQAGLVKIILMVLYLVHQICSVLEWGYGIVMELFWLLAHKKSLKHTRLKRLRHLATLKALSFAFELRFRSAILKGDSLGLIQALKSEERSLSPTGLLIEDVKMLANNFVRLLYSHIKRNGNKVVHSLAKNVLCIPDFQVWMEDIPSHIVSILQLDVIELH